MVDAARIWSRDRASAFDDAPSAGTPKVRLTRLHKRLCSAEKASQERYLRVHTDVAKGLQLRKTNELEGNLPNY